MNKYEQLKEICDIIGYEKSFDKYPDILFITRKVKSVVVKKDITEIIFTTEFRDKLRKYYLKNICVAESMYERECLLLLMFNLDNPVYYLYKLIKYEQKWI